MIVYIMRGLPGSGKSTLAREMVGPRGLVVSTDDWHVEADGVYRYKTEQATVAHAWNLRRFKAAVAARIPKIAVDNTNITRSAVQPYIEFAEANGYTVHLLSFPPAAQPDEWYAQRTLHAVPVEVIAKMRAAWETDEAIFGTELSTPGSRIA